MPAYSKIAVSIKASKKKTKLKYKATQCTIFVDGTEICGEVEGYKNEFFTESAVVEYGRFQDLFKYCKLLKK